MHCHGIKNNVKRLSSHKHYFAHETAVKCYFLDVWCKYLELNFRTIEFLKKFYRCNIFFLFSTIQYFCDKNLQKIKIKRDNFFLHKSYWIFECLSLWRMTCNFFLRTCKIKIWLSRIDKNSDSFNRSFNLQMPVFYGLHFSSYIQMQIGSRH